MKLIIAEKNSVAQSIAHAVGAYQRIKADEGNAFCYANDEYYIAFAQGHLYNLAEPQEYGWEKNFKKSYDNGELPMIPQRFKVVPNSDIYLDSLRKMLSDLINKADVTEIINACDAAREGELIFREIYNASKSNKPVKRLWISAVTDEAIKAGLNSLMPSENYDNLYRTAKVRAELDWIFGINMSRLYTALDTGYTHSVGRIVTPVLGLIVERDKEIENFVKHTSYRLMLDNGALSDDIFEDKATAEKKAAESSGKTASVEAVVKTEKSENRPKLYSLTRLQMDANDLYGYTANEVLEIAQSLYEKKFTTYPRTGSEYISDNLIDTVKTIVETFAKSEKYGERATELLANGLNIDKRIVNNDEIEDHHAIIPTALAETDTSSLSEKEKNIYELIVNRLLMTLDKIYIYNEINYEFWCEDITYRLTVKKPVQLGWRKYRPNYDDTEETAVCDYEEGKTFDAAVTVKECVTQPPKHYTDKTLLSVMENIDNRIEDSELKSAVRGKGIGTDATRAGIIEKLIRTQYIERKGKQLISTAFGRAFADSLPRQLLAVERTAEWEQLFNDIQTTGADDTDMYAETKQLVTSVVEFEKSNTGRTKLVNPDAKPKFEMVVVGTCPRCGKEVVEKKDFYGCSSYESKDNTGCGFSFSKTHRQGWFKGSITPAQAKKLLKKENISLKAVSKEGSEYTAEWQLSDDGIYVNVVKVKGAATAKSVGKCPRCGKDVVERSHAFCCSSWSAENPGCGFSIFKQDKKYNITITAKAVEELLTKGSTKIKEKTLNGEKYTEFKLEEREVNGRKWVNIIPINRGVEYGK